MSSEYIRSLDGIRAVSVLIVTLSHAGVSSKIPGGFGVTVFFFLSGFLITTLLLREYSATGNVNIAHFYLRRAIRLAPPLFLAILAAILLVLVGFAVGPIDLPTLISQVLFFYNYYSIYNPGGSIKGLDVLWSLSVEEHYYFIWPTIFLLLMRDRLKIVHLVALLLAFFLWRCIRILYLGGTEWTIYVSTDTRFDSILFGSLLAILQARYPTRMRTSNQTMYALLALSVLVLLSTFLIQNPVFRSTLRYSLQGMALMAIFHFSVKNFDALIFHPLNWPVMRKIGTWSYSIYLIHFVIVRGMEANRMVPENRIIFFILIFSLSCLWAALVYEFAEKPFQKLRRRFSPAQPPEQPPPFVESSSKA